MFSTAAGNIAAENDGTNGLTSAGNINTTASTKVRRRAAHSQHSQD